MLIHLNIYPTLIDLLSREQAVGDDRGGVDLLGQELGHQGPLRAARPQGQRTLLPLRLLCRSPLPGEHLGNLGSTEFLIAMQGSELILEHYRDRLKSMHQVV